MFREQAQKRVSLGLVISQVVKENDIKADPERVRNYINETASGYEKPEDVVNYYYQNQQMLAGVESVVLEDMAVDLILESANVTEETTNYEEVVKTN
jgi:trigger factor